MSHIQATVVRDMLAPMTLDPEERPDIADMIVAIPSMQPYRGEIALSGMTEGLHKGIRRRNQLQDLGHFMSYLTERVQADLKSESVPHSAKLTVLLTWVARLGFAARRFPSHSCCKSCAMVRKGGSRSRKQIVTHTIVCTRTDDDIVSCTSAENHQYTSS